MFTCFLAYDKKEHHDPGSMWRRKLLTSPWIGKRERKKPAPDRTFRGMPLVTYYFQRGSSQSFTSSQNSTNSCGSRIQHMNL
jgi:hypothetical protein